MKNSIEDAGEGAGRNVYTVSELNAEARALLEDNFSRV